jgi:hypothetical protein
MRRAFPFAVAALVCALAAANIWLGPGIINTRAGGDSPFLLIRTYELAANLRAGIFPARWMANAAFGLGYPFFNFYAALPYYLAAGLNMLGVDLLSAIKLVQTAGMFAAGGAMALFAGDALPRGQDRQARWDAALAAAAYVLAPFHLVNVYVRGDSLSEFWAFVWYPLILWSAGRLAASVARQHPTATSLPHAVCLSLSLAALVLTHNVSALIFAPFTAIYALVMLLYRARRSSNFAIAFLRGTALLGASAILALALSAWFWLPALGEVGQAQLGDQTTGYFYFANHFRAANLVQASLAFEYAINESLDAFAMGAMQTMAIGAGAAAWLWSNRRASRAHFDLGVASALSLLSTFMITPFSSFVWERAPLLPLAQFPWRFLSVQALFGALLIGGIGTIAFERRRWLQSLAPALTIAALAWASLARLPNERLNIHAHDVTPYSIQLYEWYTGNIGTTVRHEYLPATTRPVPRIGPDLLNTPRAALIAEGGPTPAAVSSALLSAWPAQQIWQVTADRATTIALPLLYWPAWRARLDGALVDAWSHPGSGWLSLAVPPGTHRIELRWEGTTLERSSELVSLMAWLAVAVLVIALGLRASPPARRAIGLSALAVALSMGAIAVLSRLASGPAVPPPMQTLDFARRPFPHRDPVRFESAGGSYELIAVSIEPPSLRPGDLFTLTLRWRDDRPPERIIVTQELPMGGEFARLFRHARLQTPGDPRISHHIVLTGTLPGALLLKLAATDAAGRTLTPFASDGSALETMIAGKPTPAITLLGPRIMATPAGASPAARLNVTFDNGIVLRDMDWFFASAHEVCFRPVWQRGRPNVNRADALQVSLRAFGSDGRLIAQADSQPQAGLAPTWAWPDDAWVHDSQCVPANNALHPNERYTVQIVWYRLADLQPTGQVTLRGVGGARLEDLNLPEAPGE